MTKAGRPARRHHNFYETALNARQTSPTERRRLGNSRPCLRLDSQLEPKPPLALDVHFPCVKKKRCQLATWPNEPDETRDCASATDDRNTRHPAAVSRAAARTAPSPSFHFPLDERKAARAASKSDVEVDGGLRVQVRAPRPRCRLEGASGASIEAGEAENRRHVRRAGAAPHLLQRATLASDEPSRR